MRHRRIWVLVLGVFLSAFIDGASSVPSIARLTHFIWVGGAFSPSELRIGIGDKVEWHWAGGTHSATSGVDPDDPEAGRIFDHQLSVTGQYAENYFHEETVIPYHCSYHPAVTGTITVTDDPDGVPSLTEWGWIVTSILLLAVGLKYTRQRTGSSAAA